MCGIVGYIGTKDAVSTITKGLERLEYRGYDSVGIALLNDEGSCLIKTKGKVSNLKNLIQNKTLASYSLGIGHTRWATHGVPNNVNAHPHESNDGNIVLVHNGIIENYNVIKTMLLEQGYTFESDTDTEVLVNLIAYVKTKEKTKLGKAVQIALNEVVGAYSIAVFDKEKPNEIIAARLGSPLVIGIGKDDCYIASDASPFIGYTKEAVYLNDGEMCILRKDKSMIVRSIKNDGLINPYVQQLKLSLENIEKGSFDHFMLKEIYEQPNALRNTIRGRLYPDLGEIKLTGLDDHIKKFLTARRIIIIGCGTSWHTGLIAEYMIESLARIPVEVEYASEFRYRNPIIYEDDIVLAISQSGETADTLAALKLAKEKGAFIYGICNVVGSSIARESNSGSYTHAGPEIGVASTKAFTSQVMLLNIMTLKLAYLKGNLGDSLFRSYIRELNSIPIKIGEVLELNQNIITIAQEYKHVSNILYLGRGYNFPIALEGALKLKEISYIHAEGYPAAEMKHGPIALVDESMPIVVIANQHTNYDKIISNIQEIKSRKGKIIAIIDNEEETIRELADFLIKIPTTTKEFSPLISVIALQLLAYHIAILRGCNVDQPRNLAKSVTVE